HVSAIYSTRLFFLAVLRAPPTSPLFPYTTLFRSSSISSKGQCTMSMNGIPEPSESSISCRSDGSPENPVAGSYVSTVIVAGRPRSEEHTSELQSRENLVCRLLLEKKKHKTTQKSV